MRLISVLWLVHFRLGSVPTSFSLFRINLAIRKTAIYIPNPYFSLRNFGAMLSRIISAAISSFIIFSNPKPTSILVLRSYSDMVINSPSLCVSRPSFKLSAILKEKFSKLSTPRLSIVKTDISDPVSSRSLRIT